MLNNLSRCFLSGLLTWDFIDFIQEFALDFLEHVVLVDLCHVGAGRVGHRGDDSQGGSHGRGGGPGGLHGRPLLRPPEPVELHRRRLGAAFLGDTNRG